jgi:hypothetical protein
MTKTFTFLSDPGHAWLQVPVGDVIDLGMTQLDFSSCSYCCGVGADKVLFLEEDCDAPKFLDAYERVHGAKPTINENHTDRDSFVRFLRQRCG